jgi:ribosomal protein S20
MPITKSAKKKLRVDKKRAAANAPVRAKVKTTVKTARTSPNGETINEMYSALDKGVKHNLVPQNRAARIKKRLLKAMKISKAASPFAKPKAPKKKSVK